LKPVAWAKKMPWISPEPAYPSKLLIRSIYSKPFGLAERFSNGFWHIVSIVKERRPPCPAEWLPNNLMSLRDRFPNVNPVDALFFIFHRRPHRLFISENTGPLRKAFGDHGPALPQRLASRGLCLCA